MIDIDAFLMSLKAAWVTKVINCEGKWSALFQLIISQLNLPINYIWKTTFRTVESFPLVRNFPLFYQDVLLAFDKSKHIKQVSKVNKYEIFEQPIWGNEYFKTKGHSCCIWSGMCTACKVDT